MSTYKRFDRIVGDLRIRKASTVTVERAKTVRGAKEFQRQDDILTKLYENGQLAVLRAFANDDVSIHQLIEVDREDNVRQAGLLTSIKLREPLWSRSATDGVLRPDMLRAEEDAPGVVLGAIDTQLRRMGRTVPSRKRYETSFRKLFRSNMLDAKATVTDFTTFDWRALRDDFWIGTAADWNHLRRALSRFLTLQLGDKYHPVRLQIARAFPAESEGEGRVPDISVSQFWAIVKHAPEHVQAAYVALVVTGFRAGEYLACEAHHMNLDTCSIRNPLGKTGARAQRFDPEFRAWMQQAIPSPVQYRWLRQYWVNACVAAGVGRYAPDPMDPTGERQRYDGPRIHDLRHCHGQWSSDGGAAEAAIGDSLGHKDARMTRRYTRQTNRGQTATALASVLKVRGDERGDTSANSGALRVNTDEHNTEHTRTRAAERKEA